jgi:hypothetical protein
MVTAMKASKVAKACYFHDKPCHAVSEPVIKAAVSNGNLFVSYECGIGRQFHRFKGAAIIQNYDEATSVKTGIIPDGAGQFIYLLAAGKI